MAGLDELYKEIVIDHYRRPRNQGELPTPPAQHAEGFNPLCGDEVQVYVQIEDGVVVDVAIGGNGCSISQASASMMSAAIKGKTLTEIDELTVAIKAVMAVHEHELDGGSGEPAEVPDVELGDLEALKGVVQFPVRIKCALLSWNTLAEAIQATDS